MIYCVVPEALADELLDKLESYYASDPNVEVIVDRRRPRGGAGARPAEAIGEVRDRRRPRVTGELPELAED